MDPNHLEIKYPKTFRESDVSTLQEHLDHRHSVELIGMKRVGISNFLRFFLHFRDPSVQTKNHVIIAVDLHDLVELEKAPFWTLTFKRLVDAVEHTELPQEVKDQISTLFLNSIQLQDLFLTIENFKKALNELIKHRYIPTFFFIRFDRLKDAATKQFLDNLQGIFDSTRRNLSYVFTSFRPLDQISETAFPRSALSGFSHIMYLKPALEKDSEIISDFYSKKYGLKMSQDSKNQIIQLSGGHVQYIHLLNLIIKDSKSKKIPKIEKIVQDERIVYLYEELWESLSEVEQKALQRVALHEKITAAQKKEAKYLWLTGFINDKNEIFSPLFSYFLNSNAPKTSAISESSDFTKKEHMLFSMLETNLDQICERDNIALQVWPEIESEGVSDWTIDRLVGRVRNKLKLQNSEYSIVTVKTRGYKLTRKI